MAVTRYERRGDLDGALEYRRQRGVLAAQLDMATRDARDVEQVVDQASEVARVSLDDLALVGDRRMMREQFDGGQDRRERIAQLVPQHREEAVLSAGVLENPGGLERRSDEVRRGRYEHSIGIWIKR